MVDQLLFFLTSVVSSTLLPAVMFFLALTLKHWLLDYFLVEIERTPFKMSLAAQHPLRAVIHLCYLQGISTATIIFFLFGPNPQLLLLGVLDAFVCLSYYATRLHNWKYNVFLSSTYIRGIFIAEALRLTLTALITMVYFSAGRWILTGDVIYTATLASNAFFETKVNHEMLTRAILYAAISVFGMSTICSVVAQPRGKQAPRLRWTPLVAQTVLMFYILDTALKLPVFQTAMASLCVSSTYYYCRLLLARSRDREGRRLLEAFFYLLIFTLFIGLTTFTYAALAEIE